MLYTPLMFRRIAALETTSPIDLKNKYKLIILTSLTLLLTGSSCNNQTSNEQSLSEYFKNSDQIQKVNIYGIPGQGGGNFATGGQ